MKQAKNKIPEIRVRRTGVFQGGTNMQAQPPYFRPRYGRWPVKRASNRVLPDPVGVSGTPAPYRVDRIARHL